MLSSTALNLAYPSQPNQTGPIDLSMPRGPYFGAFGKKKMAAAQYNKVVEDGLNPLRLTIRRASPSDQSSEQKCLNNNTTTTQSCLVDASTSTSDEPPACTDAGFCEPGTKVCLDSVVWLEVAGMLTVRATWRGRVYVGSLVDASNSAFTSSCPDKAVTSALSLLGNSRPVGNAKGAVRGRMSGHNYHHHHHYHHHVRRQPVRRRGKRAGNRVTVTTRSAAAAAAVAIPSDGVQVVPEQPVAEPPQESPEVKCEEEKRQPLACPLPGCDKQSDTLFSLRCHVAMDNHSMGYCSPPAVDLSLPRSNAYSEYSSRDAVRNWVMTQRNIPGLVGDAWPQLDEESQREILGLDEPRGEAKPVSAAYSDISDGPLRLADDVASPPQPPPCVTPPAAESPLTPPKLSGHRTPPSSPLRTSLPPLILGTQSPMTPVSAARRSPRQSDFGPKRVHVIVKRLGRRDWPKMGRTRPFRTCRARALSL